MNHNDLPPDLQTSRIYTIRSAMDESTVLGQIRSTDIGLAAEKYAHRVHATFARRDSGKLCEAGLFTPMKVVGDRIEAMGPRFYISIETKVI